MSEFSDFIVYADESGDHEMVNIDRQYPVFVLVFCVMRKADYTASVVPAMQQLKFNIWGHDSIILHEHEIRKHRGDFAILPTNRNLREKFYSDLNELVKTAPMTLFASIIDKEKHQNQYSNPWNPYKIALHLCMEQLHKMLTEQGEYGKSIHIIFESRGERKDDALKREFRRIARNESQWGCHRHNFSSFDFQPVFTPKSANSSGLQLADLTARPIGLSYWRPNQSNRAFKIIEPKLGERKCFP